jgi:hypothetical protein
MTSSICEYCEEIIFDEDQPHVCSERIEFEINQMFYTNNQVPTGQNMRNFVREHLFSEPSGTSPPMTMSMGMGIGMGTQTPKHDAEVFNIYFHKIQCASNIECPICMEHVRNSVKLRACTHIYCRKCIINWICLCKCLKITCPMCKVEIGSGFNTG